MNQKQKILKYAILGFIGLVGIVAIAYFLVVRPLQIRSQKANFDKAEARIDQLAVEIEKLVGKPDDTKKEKSCGYASRKFENGPRDCIVSLGFLYTSMSFASSNEIMNKVSNLIGSKLYDDLGKTALMNFIAYSGSGPSQEFSQKIITDLQNLDCVASYKYPVVPLFDKEFSRLTHENLQIGLSCGGSAMQEFFPVKD